ncbi:hypothetical protein RCG71_16830, partial [Kocuria sp. CPCC 205281]
MGQQIPLEDGQAQAVVQIGGDLDLPHAAAEGDVAQPQLLSLDAGAADDLAQQPGLFRPDPVVIHGCPSPFRVRAALQDLAGHLGHGTALGARGRQQHAMGVVGVGGPLFHQHPRGPVDHLPILQAG